MRNVKKQDTPALMDLSGFKLYLVQSGKRRPIINSHIERLTQYFRSVKDLSDESISSYLMSLLEKGRKATYLNSVLYSLRAYCLYLKYPLPKVDFFKEETPVKSTLSAKEIEAFLNLKSPLAGTKRKEAWDRWTLFFRIMAYTGMRPNEVATLTVDNVDLGRGVFVLEITKTSPRLVPIPHLLLSKGLIYGLKMSRNGILFPSVRNGRNGFVGKGEWGHNFRKRIKMLGIKRSNLSCHSLRHSFITRMLEEDVNIFKVQKIVGHRRLETTNRYTHLTTKDIIRSIKKDPLTRRGNTKEEVALAIIEAIKGFHIEQDKRFRFSLNEESNELSFNLRW